MTSLSAKKRRGGRGGGGSKKQQQQPKKTSEFTATKVYKNVLVPTLTQAYSQEGLDHKNEDRLWSSTFALRSQQSPEANRSRGAKRRREETRHDDVGLYCCFDGHGGELCSAYLGNNFGRVFSRCYEDCEKDEDDDDEEDDEEEDDEEEEDDDDEDEDEEDVADSKSDRSLRDPTPSSNLLSRTLEAAISESEDKFMNSIGLEDDSGACLLAVCVSVKTVVCGCVGDCRAVVGTCSASFCCCLFVF